MLVNTRAAAVSAALLVTAVVLAGCGGKSAPAADPTPDTATSASPTESPTESASASPTYSLADRASFLATGPDCTALQGWYTQFPADQDGETALRYVQECHEAPQPILDHTIYAGENDRLLQALLDPAVTGESRGAAHWALGKAACGMFGDGSKSLWDVASTVRDYGGTPADYQAVVAEAVKQCPSSKADLTLFSAPDVLGATAKYTAALRAAGADLSAFGSGPDADGKVAALAAVSCQSASTGDASQNGFFISTVLSVSEAVGNTLADQALNLFCPQFA